MASLPSRGLTLTIRAALPCDGSEQDLVMAGGIGDRGHPAQPSLGMAGIGVRVDKTPMRFCAVDPLVNVLPNRGVELAVALDKAADPQIAVAAGYPR